MNILNVGGLIVGVNGGEIFGDDNISQLKGFNKYSIDVWEGLPYMEIVKYAREKQADLIIMSHQSREVNPDKARLGSNMEQVIMRANCPVISINRHTSALFE